MFVRENHLCQTNIKIHRRQPKKVAAFSLFTNDNRSDGGQMISAPTCTDVTYFCRERPMCHSDNANVCTTYRLVNSVASLGFQGALQKENYRLLSVFENFAAKRLDISFLFRQAVLEILFER